jgi:hypothetical protein
MCPENYFGNPAEVMEVSVKSQKLRQDRPTHHDVHKKSRKV